MLFKSAEGIYLIFKTFSLIYLCPYGNKIRELASDTNLRLFPLRVRSRFNGEVAARTHTRLDFMIWECYNEENPQAWLFTRHRKDNASMHGKNGY